MTELELERLIGADAAADLIATFGLGLLAVLREEARLEGERRERARCVQLIDLGERAGGKGAEVARWHGHA